MATNRFDTKAKETIKWTAGNGQQIKMTVELVQHMTDTTGTGNFYEPHSLDIKWSGWIDDQEQIDYHVNKINHPVAVANFGKIGITQENYDRLMEAKRKVASHPLWLAKLARQEAWDKAEEEYEAHSNNMRRIMREQG